jgi:hypothetical protein
MLYSTGNLSIINRLALTIKIKKFKTLAIQRLDQYFQPTKEAKLVPILSKMMF